MKGIYTVRYVQWEVFGINVPVSCRVVVTTNIDLEKPIVLIDGSFGAKLRRIAVNSVPLVDMNGSALHVRTVAASTGAAFHVGHMLKYNSQVVVDFEDAREVSVGVGDMEFVGSLDLGPLLNRPRHCSACQVPTFSLVKAACCGAKVCIACNSRSFCPLCETLHSAV